MKGKFTYRRAGVVVPRCETCLHTIPPREVAAYRVLTSQGVADFCEDCWVKKVIVIHQRPGDGVPVEHNARGGIFG